jgi:hypothetical protein
VTDEKEEEIEVLWPTLLTREEAMKMAMGSDREMLQRVYPWATRWNALHYFLPAAILATIVGVIIHFVLAGVHP